MNAIEVKHLSYKHRHFQLEDISFNVPQGFVTGFIGTNGSGKTTLIRLIMDLYQPEAGDIYIWNEKMKHHPRKIKNKIGFVYSENYFNDKWTIKKLEKIIAPFYDAWDHALFAHYIKYFNLPYEQKIREFSTGMKMKLSLSLAFAHHADLFILDEPTSGLDPIVRNELLEIIQQELIDEQKTVLMSTHIISDLERIADHIVYISHGRMVVNEDKDKLLERYQLISGASEDLDEELTSLLLYKEVKTTGYLALTEHAQVFKELFGNKVEITTPTIETLMIYLEKSLNQNNKILNKQNDSEVQR